MPDINSVHDALYHDEWNMEEIELILQRDSSSVNEIERRQTPLDRVLRDKRCSIAMVKLLLWYGADPNFKFCQGSPNSLIPALYCRDRVEIIGLLIKAGARADDSSLSVALGLNAELEVIKLLLTAGADLFRADIYGVCPIYHALGYFNVDAFRSLLALQDANTASNQWKDSLLHSAVRINGCTSDFVEFLIDLGIRIDSVDDSGDTPLHLAMRKQTCHPDVINSFLRRGSPVNVQNLMGHTPLDYAITENCDSAIAQLLLKYCLLQNPDFDVYDWIQRHGLAGKFSEYANDCKCELQRSKSEIVGNGWTLFKFLQVYSGSQMRRSDSKEFNIDRLLQIIGAKLYPVYSEVIASKFHRSLLEHKLEYCNVRTVVEGSSGIRIKNVMLNYDCALDLTNFVDATDLLNVIVAFRKL